jgi:UDP-N-acetylmuramoyl-tripeptide--D-alanyl-D-alanine ligase
VKQFFKRIVVSVLVWQVCRLRAKRPVKVVAVAGSIGKTSTKFAIASLLEARYRVGYQKGNYNDVVTVPLVFFGLSLPSLSNPFAWIVTFFKIEWQLARPYPYDVVVVELGTDCPDTLKQFEYLHADIGVVTAIAPEHMEFFGTLDAVAKEEFAISDFSADLLVNRDLIDDKYLPQRPMLFTYGMNPSNYYLTDLEEKGTERIFSVEHEGGQLLRSSYSCISRVQLYSVLAAISVAERFQVDPKLIADAVPGIQQAPGRLQVLHGTNGSTIIDDTYNASPEAMKFALDALYETSAPKKIALLGNMNELGDHSPAAHTEIGQYCDPGKLSLVVTLGPDANEYLAPAAEAKGCKVVRCDSPFEAAARIKDALAADTVLLAKGSQNKVYAEETVRLLLADPSDRERLVRQSKHWTEVKQRKFKDYVA